MNKRFNPPPNWPAPPPGSRKEQIDAAPELSGRDLALLVKSPDSNTGKMIVLYAHITHLDAATGECTFRANISHEKMDNSYEYDENSVFRGGVGIACTPFHGHSR